MSQDQKGRDTAMERRLKPLLRMGMTHDYWAIPLLSALGPILIFWRGLSLKALAMALGGKYEYLPVDLYCM